MTPSTPVVAPVVCIPILDWDFEALVKGSSRARPSA